MSKVGPGDRESKISSNFCTVLKQVNSVLSSGLDASLIGLTTSNRAIIIIDQDTAITFVTVRSIFIR